MTKDELFELKQGSIVAEYINGVEQTPVMLSRVGEAYDIPTTQSQPSANEQPTQTSHTSWTRPVRYPKGAKEGIMDTFIRDDSYYQQFSKVFKDDERWAGWVLVMA